MSDAKRIIADTLREVSPDRPSAPRMSESVIADYLIDMLAEAGWLVVRLEPNTREAGDAVGSETVADDARFDAGPARSTGEMLADMVRVLAPMCEPDWRDRIEAAGDVEFIPGGFETLPVCQRCGTAVGRESEELHRDWHRLITAGFTAANGIAASMARDSGGAGASVITTGSGPGTSGAGPDGAEPSSPGETTDVPDEYAALARAAIAILNPARGDAPWLHTTEFDDGQIELAASCCQSFALDNGAFSMWKAGKQVNWPAYYEWSGEWLRHPACDWAIIPDVIGGTEEENDALAAEWPHGIRGVPVWHLNESVERLVRLSKDWPRVALGSAAEWDVSKPSKCLERFAVALPPICDDKGVPVVKLHGLRMLRPEILTKIPLSSADSTNVARNIGLDVRWDGPYQPATKETRVDVLVERIEQHQSPAFFTRPPIHLNFFGEEVA